MTKRILALILLVSLLAGCVGVQNPSAKQQYKVTFFDLFDTVTSITGTARNEEAFQKQVKILYEELSVYHQLFDIYHSYEGVTNIKDINDQAGIAPVEVDGKIIELLLDCSAFYETTDGRVNVAMGSVLSLWHQARTEGMQDPQNAELPDAERLSEAALHTDIRDMVIDSDASTVFLADAQMRLDVGAVAKGWAAQKVTEGCPDGYLISIGGNVCASGPKDEVGTPWVVGIQDPKHPESSSYLHTVELTKGCVVTSGDYQRCYEVNGQFYHHIIDPNTCYPSVYWSMVTVICEDSGIADALSTALFLMNLEEGQELLEHYDASAMWVDTQGQKFYSSSFKEKIR